MVWLACLAASAAACGGAVTYDRAYVEGIAADQPVRFRGRALVVTRPEDDRRVHVRGGVETPVGAYGREVGLALLARAFEGGARHAPAVPEALPDRVVVVEPNAAWFDWARSPTGARVAARVVLRVAIRGPGGGVAERQCDSGFVEARDAGRRTWATRPFVVAWEMCVRDLEGVLPPAR